jgi:GNAT superfamily N-acetyltransferase
VTGDAELVLAANENFVVSFCKLAEHVPGGEMREAGGVFAFVTGLPLALFNGCVVVERAAPDDLEDALEWVGGRGVPYRVWIDPERTPSLGDVLRASGLEQDDTPYPGMVLHPVREPPALSAGVDVSPVGAAELDEYLGVCVEGGLAPDLALRLFPPSLVADPDVRLFVGRLDGRPVGTSLAIRSERASGIYAVGTLPTARRRGVGSALTWAAVAAGRDWDRDTIVLQSTAMAFSLYFAMGFRTVVPYAGFSRRPT